MCAGTIGVCFHAFSAHSFNVQISVWSKCDFQESCIFVFTPGLNCVLKWFLTDFIHKLVQVTDDKYKSSRLNMAGNKMRCKKRK